MQFHMKLKNEKENIAVQRKRTYLQLTSTKNIQVFGSSATETTRNPVDECVVDSADLLRHFGTAPKKVSRDAVLGEPLFPACRGFDYLERVLFSGSLPFSTV